MANDKTNLDFSNVQKITEIAKGQLNEEFYKFPGTFAFWAAAEAEAKSAALNAKAQMEQTYAVLATQQRSSADFYKKKVTEAQIEEMVESSAEYTKVRDAYNKATGDALRVSAVVASLEKKGDILKQLGYTYSAELARLSDSSDKKK